MGKKSWAVGLMFLLAMGLGAESFKTGDDMPYFPKAAPKMASENGDSTKCFVTKITKANGYPEGTYLLELTSCDWVGASFFPVVFTYVVKPNDTLELVETKGSYLNRNTLTLVVKAVSDNVIELEKVKKK